MSDHLGRISSPVSSSPSRSTTIARPAWPWQPSSSRSSMSGSSPLSGSSEHRSSLSTSRSTPNPSTPRNQPDSSSTMRQQSLLAARQVSSSSMNTAGALQEETTRQWTFMGFEWVVRDIQKLKDFVEDEVEVDASNQDFEILKQSPVMGDNKFKLEIVCTQPTDAATDAVTDAPVKPYLSLYITSLMVDFAHPDYEQSASMMAAIKCQADRSGERGAPPEWVWEYWQTDWVFRQENEVWACPLPLLSVLLENSRIRDTDSFVISVQIHCPYGPSFPQQPSVYPVPKDLLDGLEASLDNPNTGDVRFICLEKMVADSQPSPMLNPSDVTSPMTARSSSSASSYSPFSTRMTARKRIIYAHSDILMKRSEYFATMLSSSFSENPVLTKGERKVYTIVVEEADFETMYWLLKYCYTNWLLFKETDDPRLAVDGVGAGWSAKWLHSRGGEWDWKTFTKGGNEDSNTIDTKSAASGDNVLSTAETRRPPETPQASGTNPSAPAPGPPSSSRSIPNNKLHPSPSTSQRQINGNPSRRSGPTAPPNALAISIGSPSSIGRNKAIPVPVTAPNYSPATHSGYPVSPRTARPPSLNPGSAPDPHPHPTPPPKPASALSMYQVAHRYAMPNLASLALDHMMSTITPQSSFALLLATSVWDELHSLVEDYVVEKWDEVSASDEFERCCQEVAAGEWGPDGGKTLMSIFRRLRSPQPSGFSR